MTKNPHPLIVVMGVSGSGKSTIGVRLAETLGIPFIDGDDLHPAANVEKMGTGIPLSDSDRWPWLDRVGVELARHSATGVVVACSALRRAYRDAIRGRAADARFVLLSGSRDQLAARMAAREDHFMPAALLDSQLDILEPFDDAEGGIVVDVASTPDDIVASILERLDR